MKDELDPNDYQDNTVTNQITFVSASNAAQGVTTSVVTEPRMTTIRIA